MERISGIYGLENFLKTEVKDTVTKMLSHGAGESENIEVWSDDINLALGVAGNSSAHSNSGDTIISSGNNEIEIKSLLSDLQSDGLEETLKKLKGKFCFAWWNEGSGKLVIARDRLGINPIYWCVENKKGAIMFASEMKTLLASGLIARSLNNDAVIDYLRYSTVHVPKTLVEGIHVLEPGCAIEVQDETVNVLRWWDTAEETLLNGSKSVKSEMLRAVRSSLTKDSQVVYLSGGVDSSSLISTISQLSENPVINTFAIEFEGSTPWGDSDAYKTSVEFSTNHTTIKVSEESSSKKLHKAIELMDSPAIYGIKSHFIATSAKEAGFNSLISDLGFNEIFGKHPVLKHPVFKTSVELMKHRWLTAWPRGLRLFAGWILKTLSPGESSNKKAELLASNYFDLEHTYPLARQTILDSQIKLLTPNLALARNSVFYGVANILRVGKSAFKLPFLSKVSILEMHTHLASTLLPNAQTFNSENSLDYTTPFLDHNLVTQVLANEDLESLTINSINKQTTATKFPWELRLNGVYLDFHNEGIEALKDLVVFSKKAVYDFDNNSLSTANQRLSLSILGHYIKQNNLS